MATRDAERSSSETAAALQGLRTELDIALASLRDLAHGIYPTILEIDGLPAALREAARRAPIPTAVECDGAARYATELETAVYFCCVEALQNAVKHAGDGARAQIRLAQRDDVLWCEVSDDGRGFELGPGSANAGLQNMTDRIGAVGGALEIASLLGGGTTIVATIPLASVNDPSRTAGVRTHPAGV